MKEEVISELVEKGFLVSPDLNLRKEELEDFFEYLNSLKEKPFLLNQEIYNEFRKKTEKDSEEEPETEEEAAEQSEEQKVIVRKRDDKRPEIETKVKIKKNYTYVNKKIDISDWVTYYFDRYNKIRDILQNREELRGAISIGRVAKASGRQKIAVIGMIKEIRKTFSGSLMITLEDPTGTIRATIKGDALQKAGELVFDEVIGITGTKSGDYIYVENILFPEIPTNPIKKAPDEVYAAFLSDTHVGSNMFLPKELNKFIDWINGRLGDKKQQDIAKKVKYLFVVGDLVDGIGVYPGQENELLIKDIYAQYQEFAKYFSNIPEDINIIILPGNHDALRLAEPQHALFKDIAKEIYSLPNVTMVSNPSMVNIHNVKGFPGFDTLLYHGYSFDYYVANVPSLRKHGYDRADLLMEFLLRKRHLAPTHGSTLINPMSEDFLVIDKIPDIFATAHIHKAKIGRYKHILNICCSCFQDKTSFQEKVGHNPEPARIPLLNLQKNEAKLLRFR